MKALAALVFGAAILLLAFDKVRNEHRMTAMYERQAVALERIDDRLKVLSFAAIAQSRYVTEKRKAVNVDEMDQELLRQTDCHFDEFHDYCQ